MPKICESAIGLKFLADNSLEEYRAESILTKEPETIAWLDAELKAGQVLLDVGANIGIYTCYAAKRCPGARVLAIEPVLTNFVRLCENVRLNNLENVTPLLLGFSDKTSIDALHVRDERVGGSGSQLGHAHDEHGASFQPSSIQQTLVYTVDGFIESFSLPVPQHVKIDVDGNEAQIVSGMERLLTTPGLRSFLIEMNLADQKTDSVIARIESFGFTRANLFNSLASHSRHRRRRKASNVAENLIFTRMN